MKPINLTLHRNTRGRRNRQKVSKALLRDAKEIASQNQVQGYALVAWTSKHSRQVAWEVGDTMPINVMPVFVKQCLERRLNKRDIQDEIYGPLPDDAS